MTFHDYVRIFRKRWRIIVLTVLAGLFGAAAYSSTLPRVFAASAQFQITPPREASLVGLKYRGPLPADVIRSMGTKEFAQRVHRRLLDDSAVSSGSVLIDPRNVDSVRAGVSISRPVEKGQGSNVITISVNSEDPIRTALVANAYVEEVVLFVADFMEEQRKELRRYLRIRLEGAETGVEAANDALKRQQRLEAEIHQVEDEIRALEGDRVRLADWAAAREETRRRLETAEAAAEIRSDDPNVQTLSRNLGTLLAQREEILSQYTPTHPRFAPINSEIQRTLPRLRAAVEESNRRMDLQWSDLSAREATARARFDAARAALDEMENPYILQQRASLQFQQFGAIANKMEEERFLDALETGDVEVTARATAPQSPSSPAYRLHVTAGGMIGFLVGVSLVFILETLDTSIGTIEDVESYLGLPVLGVIPFIRPATEAAGKPDEKGRLPDHPVLGPMLVTHHSPNAVSAEAYRALRTHIISLRGEGRHKIYLLTSAGPQEGKSTTSSNLAVMNARTGLRTLYIEANMRRPTSQKIFHVQRAPGLSEVLMGADWRPFIREIPGVPNLSLLTAGAPPSVNPAELLLRPRLAEVLDEIRPAFDIVIVDAPPVLPVADPSIIAACVDEVVLVYFVGKAAREAILRAKTHLEQAGGKFRGHLLGVVLNHLQPEAQAGYYYYYYHSRYYGA